MSETKQILDSIINDFSTEKFNLFFRRKTQGKFREINQSYQQYDDSDFKNGLKLGEAEFGDGKLLVCAFEVQKSLSERSGKKAQYEKAKRILKSAENQVYSAGIFVFYDQSGNFRFSLVYPESIGTRRQWNHFKRFTYFVSQEFTNKTFLQRIGDGDFSTLAKIKEAFSVEKVTKEFYQDIANWYFWAVSHCQFPKDAEAEENGRNIAVIRLITRMIFIWFMRERGLINKDLFEKQQIQDILKNLNNDESSYYTAILQNLFFATLSTKKEERQFGSEIRGHKGYNPDFGNQYVFRYQEMFKNSGNIKDYFGDIPFLNGGLFECLDDKKNGIIIDGFSRTKKNQPEVPNLLFFGAEKKVDLNKAYGTKNKTYKVRGLLDILSSFNFTIDENSPDDADIALDPELLGRVFENLLASFNPETSTTARKATGSYYTPREIVDYMVAESLKTYFKTHLTDIEKIDKKLEQLFSNESSENSFDERQSKKLVELIESVKIVDPAVGSGAFPMGALNKLVFILNKVDPGNKLWKEAQLKATETIPDANVRNKIKKEIENYFGTKQPDYWRKLYLIQNCIYGVDIQQIAVEITKLRFFISLLVDEDKDDIQPLPNLDFKIMQGNSLLEEYEGIKLFDEKLLEDQEPLQKQIEKIKNKQSKLQSEYLSLHTKNQLTKTRQAELNNELKSLAKQLKKLNQPKKEEEIAGLFDEQDEAKQKRETLKKLHKEFFETSDKKEKDNIREQIHKIEWDLIEATLKKENKLDKLKDLEKFKKSKNRPFFLWKLYFAEVFEKGGFDVVIANPPYIRQEKIGLEYKNLLRNKYPNIANGTADLYVYFYGLGLKIIKENGVLIFISLNKYLKTKYGIGLRNLLTENYTVDLIIDFFELPVFQASTDAAITKIINNTVKSKTRYFPVKTLENLNLFELTSGNYQNVIKDLTEWKFVSNQEEHLLNKIHKDSITLKDFTNNKIYSGIKTAFNEAYVLKNEIAQNLLKTESNKIIRKYAQSTDIKKWRLQDENRYFLATEYNLDVKNKYPSAYNYLLKYQTQLKKRQDQGKNWWNLRSCRYYPDIGKPKIIYMHTAKDHEFYLDEEGRYINNSCYMIISANKYLLSYLNSKLFKWYKKIKFVAYGDAEEAGRVKLDYNKMITIPIKKISEPAQQPFITLINQILAITKSADYLANPDKQAKVKEYEKQIDKLVYKLYELTPEEIKIVESKN